MSGNLFLAEQHIIDRVKAAAPELVTVANPSAIAGVKELKPYLPGCFVMPGEGQPRDPAAKHVAQDEMQFWDLVIVIQHQSATPSSILTETTAGTLMMKCINALSGWNPGIGFLGPFIYEGRDQPDYKPGYCEFPLRFSIRALLGTSA